MVVLEPTAKVLVVGEEHQLPVVLAVHPLEQQQLQELLGLKVLVGLVEVLQHLDLWCQVEEAEEAVTSVAVAVELTPTLLEQTVAVVELVQVT
jgi:hypothetical protein